MVDGFLNPYPSIEAYSINPYLFSNFNGQKAENMGEYDFTYTDKQNMLEIPKIGITAPIVFPKTTDVDLLGKELDSGVVFYPGSAYPGKTGQMVILGHSAPAGWPQIKYEWVFSKLNELEPKDSIIIHFNNRQYKYTVRKKTIIKKGADIPIDPSSINQNTLTLISCWPPGKNLQRIAVEALILYE